MLKKPPPPPADWNGEDYAGMFAGKFNKFDRHKSLKARRSAESQAMATPKQRARKRKRTVRLNFRTTPQVNAMIEALMHEHGTSKTEAIDKAIEETFERMRRGDNG